ncbi:MAG: hypothetical protein RX318_00585 [bacterium]|nr:hypothetical protein [bacterium]
MTYQITHFNDPTDKLSDLKELFARYPNKPYSYYRELPSDVLESYFQRVVEDHAARGELVVAASRDSHPRGVAFLLDLPWDTDIFGISMGRVVLICDSEPFADAYDTACHLLASCLGLAERRNITHLVCQVSAREVPVHHALEAEGFRLMDTITIHTRSLPARLPHPTKASAIVRSWEERDVEALCRLAASAFGDREHNLNRLHSDPLLQGRADSMYEMWLKNSLTGEQADLILVAEVEGAVGGFLTVKFPTALMQEVLPLKIASVPLNAVDAAYRGRGLYRLLVWAAFEAAHRHEHDYLEIKTQVTNLAVERTWQSMGGTLQMSYHSFHRVVKSPGG